MRGKIHKIIGFVFVIIVTMMTTTCYAAKGKRTGYKPRRYAAIVINARSNEVIDSFRPDLICHPASLTKMMTLYMIFEAIKKGRLRMSTKVPVSKRASRQPPTKLGIKPGSKVTVKTIVFSLITKSANDMAVAIAEELAGSEKEFARQMTAKAKLLGMRHTVFHNASGLPHPKQLTTARDMATLSRALLYNFPNMYGYFRTRVFVYKGRRLRNHNHLLGKVKGVEGIKTGYTVASGYNLAASATRYYNHRSVKLIAVVLGGPTWRWRDQRMTKLLEENFRKYKTGRLKIRRYTPKPIQIKYSNINPSRPLARPNPRTIDTVVQKIVLDQYVEDIIHQSRHIEVILPKPRVYSDDAIVDAMIAAREHIMCPKPRPDEEIPVVRKVCAKPQQRPTIEELPPEELQLVQKNTVETTIINVRKPLPRPKIKTEPLLRKPMTQDTQTIAEQDPSDPSQDKPKPRPLQQSKPTARPLLEQSKLTPKLEGKSKNPPKGPIIVGKYNNLKEAMSAAKAKRDELGLDNATVQTQTIVENGKTKFQAEVLP